MKIIRNYKKSYVLVVLLLISILLISACDNEKNVNVQDNKSIIAEEVCGNGICESNEKYSSCSQDCQRLELKDIALKLEDLPLGYETENRGVRTQGDVGITAIKEGWKEGYLAIFRKTENSDIKIENYLSIYPKDKIKSVLYSNTYKPETTFDEYYGYEFVELEKPNIGDDGRAFREKTFYVSNSATISIYYRVVFNKYDVHINVIGPDYEEVKELAKKIEERI